MTSTLIAIVITPTAAPQAAIMPLLAPCPHGTTNPILLLLSTSPLGYCPTHRKTSSTTTTKMISLKPSLSDPSSVKQVTYIL